METLNPRFGRTDLEKELLRLKHGDKYVRHVPNAFPHYSSHSTLCMCLDKCCQGPSGCKCRSCPCQTGKISHGSGSISDNTISSTLTDGKKNGSPKLPENGGKNDSGSKMVGTDRSTRKPRNPKPRKRRVSTVKDTGKYL